MNETEFPGLLQQDRQVLEEWNCLSPLEKRKALTSQQRRTIEQLLEQKAEKYTSNEYDMCYQNTILEAFQGFLSQKVTNDWIKTPNLCVYLRQTQKFLHGSLLETIEIANFSSGDGGSSLKPDAIIAAIDAIHAFNPTCLTYIEGDYYVQISPPAAVQQEVFALGNWLEDNGWQRYFHGSSSHYYNYYKFTEHYYC